MAFVGDIIAVLRADRSKWTPAMQGAGADVKKLEGDIKASVSNINAAGQNLRQFGQAGLAISVPFAAAGGAALKFATDFQGGMNQVQAVSGATASEFEALRTKALELGNTTKFSATEAANGMAFLGQAGFSADQQLSAIGGTLDLAAAGSLSLGEAADIASNVLSGFGENASRAGEVADLLATSAANSNTNVRQMGDAMSFVAPVSKLLGVSMSETAGFIGVLSNAGIQGARAGTNLRAVMASLAQPTKAAAVALKELGVETRNADGSMRPMPDILRDLGGAGMGAEQAIAIFGEKIASAGSVIANSIPEYDKLQGEFAEMEGNANSMASTLQQGLPGAFTLLGSAVETAGIKIVDSGIGTAFEEMIRTAAGLVQGFGDLPSPVLAVTGVLGGLVAVVPSVALGLGGLIQLVPVMKTGMTAASGAVVAFGTSLKGLAASAIAAAPSLATIGTVAAGAAAAGAAAFAAWELGKWLADNVGLFSDLGDAMAGVIESAARAAGVWEDWTEETEANAAALDNVQRNLKLLGQNGVTLTQKAGESMADFSKRTNEAVAELSRMRSEGKLVKTTTGELAAGVKELKTDLDAGSAAAGAASEAMKKTGDALKGAGDEAKKAKPLFDDAWGSLDNVKLSSQQVKTETDALTAAYQGLGQVYSGTIQTAGDLAAAKDRLRTALENSRTEFQLFLDTVNKTQAQETARQKADALTASLQAGDVEAAALAASMSAIGANASGANPAVSDFGTTIGNLGPIAQPVNQEMSAFVNSVGQFPGDLALAVTGLGDFDTAIGNLKQSVINLVSDTVLGKLDSLIAGLIAKIPGVTQLGDALGRIAGTGGGAVVTGTSAASQGAQGAQTAAGNIPSGGGGGGGGLGGAAGAVDMISGAITAVSSVISNFQLARQETTLNAIELENRQAKDLLRDNVAPALWQIVNAVEFGPGVKAAEQSRDALVALQSFMVPKLDDIFGAVAFGPLVKASERTAAATEATAQMLPRLIGELGAKLDARLQQVADRPVFAQLDPSAVDHFGDQLAANARLSVG